MLGHFASGSQSRSPAPDDENGRACTGDALNTPMLTQPGTQAPHQRPWHISTSLAADDCKSGRHSQLRREGTASMDVLTRKFSNSRLRLDNGIPPRLSQYSASACSSVTSFGQPAEAIPEMEPCYPRSSSDVPGRHAILSSMSTASTTESDHAGHIHNLKHDVRRLRRKPSSRFLNEANADGAIQARVEGMISAGTQCNVYIPPLVPIVPIETDEGNGMDHQVGEATLEVDDGIGDDESDIALIDRLLSLRRASGTLGIRKSGFPLYRSSTDTALRCQNLVRNKPRMRRRKARPKSSLSAMSAEEPQP